MTCDEEYCRERANGICDALQGEATNDWFDQCVSRETGRCLDVCEPPYAEPDEAYDYYAGDSEKDYPDD
jgi:hypothetical protein